MEPMQPPIRRRFQGVAKPLSGGEALSLGFTLTLATFFLSNLLAVILIQFTYLFYDDSHFPDGTVTPPMLWAQFLTIAVNTGCALFFINRLRSQRLNRLPIWITPLIGGGLAAVTLFVTGIVAFLWQQLLNAPVEEQIWISNSLQIEGWYRYGLIAFIAVLGPIHEEIFFRGFLFSFTERYYGIKTAYLVSAVLFALIHLNPSALPVYFIYGLAFAWGHRVSGSLWVPIIAHIGINSIAVTIQLLQ